MDLNKAFQQDPLHNQDFLSGYVTLQLDAETNASNVPNLLTSENLSSQQEASKFIEKPLVAGTFNSEKHYLDTLALVLNSTNETRNRIIFLLNKILPYVTHKQSLLDIGPGDCSVTKWLAPYFEHLTAVDPNKTILSALENNLTKSEKITKLQTSVLDTNLPENSYDMALLLHILYYVNREKWINVVYSIYNSLNINGYLVIALGGDELGKADLIRHFGGSTLEIDSLADMCKEMFQSENVSLYASTESFVTTSAEAMFHIASFMLADANTTALSDVLEDYIESYFKNRDGFYEMTTKQKYIVVQKPNELKMDIQYDPKQFPFINQR